MPMAKNPVRFALWRRRRAAQRVQVPFELGLKRSRRAGLLSESAGPVCLEACFRDAPAGAQHKHGVPALASRPWPI